MRAGISSRAFARIGAAGLLACLMLVPAAAQGATRYAEPGGNGPAGLNGCPQQNPCDIEAAVENAAVADGDLVSVMPGTHNLADVLVINDAISVVGLGPGLPTITGTAPIVIFQTLSLPAVTEIQGLRVIGSGSSATLVSGGGSISRVYSVNTGFGAACGVLDTTVTNSVCRATGGGAAVSMQDAGPGTRSTTLVNVTAVSSSNAGIGVSSETGLSQTLDMRNTIARGNPSDVAAADDGMSGSIATVTASSSNYATEFENSVSSVTDPGTGDNQDLPPLFIDVVTGNLHQSPTSPTINNGASDPLLGFADLDGRARVQGSGPDIGAYEFDQTRPNTVVLRKPRRRTDSRRARIRFRADEANATFECKLDRRRYRACTSPLRLRNLGARRHTLRIRATDPTGNVEAAPARIRWRVLG